MTTATTRRQAALEQLRGALSELFGAERRLRGRHQGHGLNHSQLRALFVLERHPEIEMTAGDLARGADLNPASVTAMLDQLQGHGIVERRRSDQDKRICMISLTDKGRTIVDEERSKWVARWDEGLRGLSEEELLAALAAMQRISHLLDGL
jgi:DNA-binding MarR family transcriptional regulator